MSVKYGIIRIASLKNLRNSAKNFAKLGEKQIILLEDHFQHIKIGFSHLVNQPKKSSAI